MLTTFVGRVSEEDGSMSMLTMVPATGAFVDHVIELPVDDDNLDNT